MKKISHPRFGRHLWLALVVLAIALTIGAAPVATAAEQNPEAKAILMKMAEFMAKAPSFSVTLRSSYDAIQEDGQYIEFGEKRHILLQRPDRLRVETERSDGERNLIFFDGKKITAFKPDDNVYAQVEKAGTVDDTLVFLVRDMQFTLPLARILHTGFAQQMENKKLTAISYVEENTLFDVVTDHLALRSEGVDMQLWVAQGEQPLPRRVVLTYMDAPGQPQFRGDFTEWFFNPQVATHSFTFSPPQDAEQIPIIVRDHQRGSIPEQKGAEK